MASERRIGYIVRDALVEGMPVKSVAQKFYMRMIHAGMKALEKDPNCSDLAKAFADAYKKLDEEWCWDEHVPKDDENGEA